MAVSTIFSDRFHKATQGLQDLMDSYPGMEMGHHLSGHLQLLQKQSSPLFEYPIELLLLDMPKEEQLYRLLDFLEITPEDGKNLPMQLNDSTHRFQFHHELHGERAHYRISVYSSAHLPIRSTANLAPCLKIVCWFSSEPPAAEEIEPILLRLDAEGGVVFFLNSADTDFMQGFPKLKVLPLRADQLPDKLSLLLESDRIKAMLPLAHSMRLVQGLEKVSESFYQFIAQQEKDIKTKKFNAQQDINTVKQEEKLNLRDLFQQLKGGLQRDFSECERGIQDQLVRLGQRHVSNSLMAQVESLVQQIDHLQEENFAGNIRMTLPTGTLDILPHTVFQGLRAQVEQDVFAFKEFVKQEGNDLKEKLKEHHIPFSYTPHLKINPSRLEANIAEYVQFTQKYEVEKKQLQFSDYMRAATAPFMGVMSIFLISRFIPPLRKLNEYMWLIGLILIPIAIYSFYMFIKNTKARKAHDYDTELNRMRENLLNESRGMIRKVTDEWQREIIGALREELNQMVNTLEQIFTQATEQHKDKMQHAQRSVQRRVQGLEQRERSHQGVLKNKETYDRSLAQFKGELTNQYQQQLQQL
ncbi:preprotein translocase subunit SecD family protein [Sphingobacterium pedocola]|uniref:Uncharacterized protein n=1 Tax=Sphingobacterium pedocola TaxID=2082722 RepID=A0ABR9TA47_9SPHI|nr:hypothetical protein [Sphingobacterium pedocola]MBE8721954.1 hypothetical protein [Sphingobacterium pedocola]